MKKLFTCTFLLSFFISFSFSQDKPAIPYGNNPQAGKFYDIRGFKMYAETYGNGKPLLFIHGNSGAIDHWNLIIA